MNKKRFPKFLITFVALFFVCSSFSFASIFFSGYAGTAINTQAVKNKKTPSLTADAFFAGQFDFSGIFLLRSELSVKTDDIFTNGVFKDTPAYFSIDELSLSTRFMTNSSTQIATVFIGEFESIGSDLFLQRQFGISPINSKLTDSIQGLNGTAIYPFSGLGGAYTVKFLSPQALGTYLYANTKEDILNLNLDFRYAGVAKRAVLDFAFGVAFPIETKDSKGEDVVLLIRTMDLHTGFSLLLGNRHSTSLFLQGGVKRIRLNPNEQEKVLRLSDLYFLIEPRFATKKLDFTFTLFNIPKNMAEDFFYISNPLGCNLGLYFDNIQMGLFNMTLGTNITISSPDTNLTTINSISKDSLSLQVAPFVTSQVFGGTLNLALKLDILNLKEWYESFKFTAGYKAQL